MSDLNGKTVLVTGAATGIGEATARLFHARGAQVVLFDRNVDMAHEVARSLGEGAAAIGGDVRSLQDNHAAVAMAESEFGKLDILVLNAGVFDGFLPLEATDERLFDEVISVNVKGYFMGCKAALPALRKTKGSVVMVASTAGFHSQQGGLVYTAAKHAIVGLIREFAFEASADGIRVNGVAPGGTPTELRNAVPVGQEYGDDRSLFENPDVMGFIKMTTPLGKAGSPEEVARAIAFMAVDATHTTGHVLRVDGGYEVRGVPMG